MFAIVAGSGRACVWAAALGSTLLTAPQAGLAQLTDDPAAVMSGHRLVHRFDFEEAKFNNFEDLPRYWYPIGRPANTTDRGFMRHPIHAQLVAMPGFPAYTTVEFDRPQREDGPHRLHLGLNGGNVGAFLEVGALPAVPRSDYLISARVTTKGLGRARAQMIAYFVNSTGNRIDESVSSSPLVQTDGREQTMTVKLNGDYEGAAWIGIQIELLQPRQQPDAVVDPHHVHYDQVEGDAWFDDISVWHLPHVSVQTQSVVNVIRAPARPRLGAQVRDLTARALLAQMTLYDHRMKPVATSHYKIDPWTPVNWKWDPPIERYGWYLADLIVTERGGTADSATGVPVARAMTSLLWLPDEKAMHAQDASRFRIVAEGLSDKQLQLVSPLLDQTRLASLVTSIWHPHTDVENIDAQQAYLSDVVQSIVGHGRQIVMSLAPVPQQLVQNHNLDPNNPITIFDKGPEVWMAYLTPVMMRHGQRVRAWSLGSTENPMAFFVPRLPEVVQSIHDSFRNMVPQPTLILPWRLDQSRRQDIMEKAAYAVEVPVSVMPQNIRQHTLSWEQSPPVEYWLHLRELPVTQMTHDRRVVDLALRMLYAWEARPAGLAIPRPWAYSDERHMVLFPDSLMGVFTAMAHRLAGRRVIGRLSLGPGLRCMILDGPSGAMLAAWNRRAHPSQAVIDMFLGPAPQAVDLWGNRRDVPLVNRRHRLELDTTPTFIEGVNANLAMFRASFRMEPPFIESQIAQHERVISFTNPWPVTISGHMTIIRPDRWDIQPKVHHFSLAAGQTTTVGVQLEFPVTETAGKKQLMAHFDFIADQRYTVDVSTPIELGLTNVGFDATLEMVTNPETGTRDALITQMISNKGSEPTALYCFANLVGYRRQEKIIPRLKPGQLVIRRFFFRDAAETLKEHNVRVGVRESIGPAVFNMILEGRGL